MTSNLPITILRKKTKPRLLQGWSGAGRRIKPLTGGVKKIDNYPRKNWKIRSNCHPWAWGLFSCLHPGLLKVVRASTAFGLIAKIIGRENRLLSLVKLCWSKGGLKSQRELKTPEKGLTILRVTNFFNLQSFFPRCWFEQIVLTYLKMNEKQLVNEYMNSFE